MRLRAIGFSALAAACLVAPGAAAVAPPPIVFAADDAPALSGEIYRLDATGRLVDLSNSPFTDTVPAVAPDGGSVAFRSYRGEGGIYVASVDGSRLKRLETPPIGTNLNSRQVELAWAPDSKRLAIASGDGASARLSVVGPGLKPVVLAHGVAFLSRWSPDGRLVTALIGRRIRAYHAAGGLAWSVPVSDAFFSNWSPRGSLLTILGDRVRIFDERGQLGLAFPGRAARWSDDGKRIASIAGSRVEVRTAAGRVLFRKSIRGLARQRTNVIWAGPRRVGFLVDERPTALDLRTGRTSRLAESYFLPRSPNGRFVALTAKRGSQFAVRVARPDGSRPETYGLVRACHDDGALVAGLQSLQFVPGRRSLVFETYCPEPLASLYAVNPDGSGLTRLTNRSEHEASPSWSPDGTLIAYTRFDAVGGSCKGCPGSLAVAAADGSVPRVLTNPTGDAIADTGARWSPDGSELLFARSYFNKASELFVVPAAGGAPRDLQIAARAGARGPTRIAYVDDATQPASLWTALPDGSDRRKLTDVPGEIAADGLAWSSDGRLAYAEPQTGGIHVFAGSSEQHVQVPFRDIRSLDWSTDSSRFVVAALAPGAATYDVFSMRTDGTDVQRLTTDVDAYSASWR